MSVTNKTKWYHKKGLLIMFLFLLPPVGIIGMFLRDSKLWKKIVYLFFGLFTQKFKGAMFGLGSGEDCPALHNPDYDFPDEIIETGIAMFKEIITTTLKNRKEYT